MRAVRAVWAVRAVRAARAAGVGPGARKTLLFMAGGLEGGGRQARAVGAVWAVRAVRAVRAVGVGHGLEPVKHCFSWQERCGGGGEGGVGGGR